MDVAAFFDQVGRRRARRAVARRRVPRRRAPAASSSATARPPGPTPGVIVPWMLWRRYGDRRLLERHWDAMERYMDYLLRHNPDLLWTARRGNDYGDWLSVGAAHAARRARDRVLGLRRALMAEMARRARPARARRALRAPARGDRAPRSTRAYVGDDALHRGRHADRLPARAAHGPAARTSCAPRAAERLVAEHRAATTGTSRPASSASACCARCSASAATRDVAHELLLKDTLPVVGLLDPPRRDHDLGALGRLDRGRGLPDRRR